MTRSGRIAYTLVLAISLAGNVAFFALGLRAAHVAHKCIGLVDRAASQTDRCLDLLDATEIGAPVCGD